MNVHLPDALHTRLVRHLESAYPNEGGGFLLGTADGDAIVLADVIEVANTFAAEEQYHRYAMTPGDWVRLEDLADERGLTLVGYFHSHPNSPAIPSVYDRDHALPNFIYIITAVYSREGQPAAAEMRVWRLQPDRAAFSEETLTVTA